MVEGPKEVDRSGNTSTISKSERIYMLMKYTKYNRVINGEEDVLLPPS